MNNLFHYGEKYHKHRKFAMIFGFTAIGLVIPLVGVFAFIGIYNESCAGSDCGEISCDGSTATCFSCSSCTPSTAPVLFAALFLWLAVVIAFAIVAIINIAKAKENKIPIPYTPEELAQMEQVRIQRNQLREARLIYVDEYYAYRRKQTVFSILAGVCGLFILSGVYEAIIHEQERRRMSMYGTGYRGGSFDILYSFVVIIIHAIGAAIFIYNAFKNKELKEEHMIERRRTNMNGGMMNPYAQNLNNVNPYAPMLGQAPPMQNGNPYAPMQGQVPPAQNMNPLAPTPMQSPNSNGPVSNQGPVMKSVFMDSYEPSVGNQPLPDDIEISKPARVEHYEPNVGNEPMPDRSPYDKPEQGE